MKVGVIGAGAWGTALAFLSARSGNDVTLWSYDGLIAEFDGISKPEKLTISKEMADLVNVDTWLIVTPAAFFRETLRKAVQFYKSQPIIICTKGIEAATDKFMSEVLQEELPQCKEFGVLSGPQFAREVAAGMPTGSTLAGTDTAVSAGQVGLNELYLEPSNDVIGTEICGVGKNAVALISGYASINAAGENERAMIFTRAWNEVVAFGLASGAKIESFLGLCGMGDLFLSATSTTSRNYSAGVAIAKGEEIVGTVEGISALNGLIKRAKEKGVSTPILSEIQSEIKI